MDLTLEVPINCGYEYKIAVELSVCSETQVRGQEFNLICYEEKVTAIQYSSGTRFHET